MSESIQGSSSSKYIKEPIPGYSDSSDKMTHQSVQDLWSGRGASDTLIHGVTVLNPLAKLIETGSVKRLIKITGHGASVNDFIKLNTGNAYLEEVAIVKIVDADYFIIAKEINAAIGDEVFFLRAVTPSYNPDGSAIVALSLGTKIDAATMPTGGVSNLGWLSAIYTFLISGLQSAAKGTSTVSGVTSTAIDANHQALDVKTYSESQTGEFAEDLTVSTTVETFTAPAGAFACFIEAKDTNPTNIRVVMGGTASTTSGIQFQPGRSEFYQGGSNISYCTESGAVGELSVQWFKKS